MAAAAANAVTRYFQFGRLHVRWRRVVPHRLNGQRVQEQLIGCFVFLVRVAIPRDRSDQPICFEMYSNANGPNVFSALQKRAIRRDVFKGIRSPFASLSLPAPFAPLCLFPPPPPALSPPLPSSFSPSRSFRVSPGFFFRLSSFSSDSLFYHHQR